MKRQEVVQDEGREFYLAIPGEQLVFPWEEKISRGKTALWVPYQEVVKQGFSASVSWPEVLVSRDVIAVLKIISRFSQISLRDEVEDDPEKQQIIFYTAIVCKNHLLFYQRAGESTTKLPQQTLGDARLRGRYSIGVGGHKTEDDILSVEGDLLDVAIPLVANELKMMIGVNRGLLAEVEEEIGVTRTGFTKPPKILGAFMDRRKITPENPKYKNPIGFVHLALPTIVELDPEKTKRLRFFEREITWAGWYPLEQAGLKLEELMSSPYGVDPWTEVFIREFLSNFSG